jgi:hypothetical protein
MATSAALHPHKTLPPKCCAGLLRPVEPSGHTSDWLAAWLVQTPRNRRSD